MRVLFCYGISQNFFDLPSAEIGTVFTAFSGMLAELAAMPGVRVIGDIDDDQGMVGPSEGWPWTCYVLADVADFATVARAAGLVRTTAVGEHRLWRYVRVEARTGRPLTVTGSTDLSAARPGGSA